MSRMTRLVSILLLLFIPSIVRADLFVLGAAWSGTFSTYNSSGTLTNADSTPTCEAFIGSSSTAINAGTVTNISAGFYRYQITMSTGNGFAAGSSYGVLCTAVVGGTTQKVHHQDGIYLLGTPNVAGILQADLTRWSGSAPNGLSSGRVDSTVGALQNNVVTAAGINADAVTAAKLASDVTTEIQANLTTIPKNTTLNSYHFKLTKAGSAYTGGTSGTITCQIMIDSANWASCNASTQASIVEKSLGWYLANVVAADLNGNVVAIRFYVPTDSAVVPWESQFVTGH